MERRSCELQFDDTFVFTTLQEIGVTVSKLHEIYDRLFKSKVRFLILSRIWASSLEDCFDCGIVMEQSTGSFSNYFPFGGCGGSEKNHVPKDTSLEWPLSVRCKCRVLLNACVFQAASVLRLFCCSTYGTCCKLPEEPAAASRSFWQNSVADSWLHVADEVEGLWSWNELLPSDRKLYEFVFPYPSTHPAGQWESLASCMMCLSLDASWATLPSKLSFS